MRIVANDGQLQPEKSEPQRPAPDAFGSLMRFQVQPLLGCDLPEGTLTLGHRGRGAIVGESGSGSWEICPPNEICALQIDPGVLLRPCFTD